MSAQFKRDLLLYGGIDCDTGSILLKGNIVMLGNGDSINSLTVSNLTVSNTAFIPNISFESFGNILREFLMMWSPYIPCIASFSVVT